MNCRNIIKLKEFEKKLNVLLKRRLGVYYKLYNIPKMGASTETARGRVIQTAQKKHMPVFQMFLRSDKYRFDFYQVK